MIIDGKTKLYGIIGNPVTHTFSPAMHNAAFAANGTNGVYLPFPALNIETAVTGIRGLGVQGVSVTIPYKESVIPFLDGIAPVAQQIGAVNTILFENGKLIGLNTDWRGAMRALEEKIDLTDDVDIVIVGAGGSARAIGFGLLVKGLHFVLCSRTESRGKALATELKCPWVPLSDIEGLSGKILINATSVGMSPHIENSPVPKKILPRFQLVMDIVYAPLKTRLLREAEASGCEIINGLDMLLYQGVAQFELWTGKTAPVDVMRKALLEALGSRKE